MEKLFKKATNQQACLKCGLLGFSGAGKTFTATKIAIGLHKLIKSNKPVYFLDTETGSDWVKPIFDQEKIDLQIAKTRAFSDLLEGIKEAEKNASILIIDSISHFWTELLEAFMKKKEIKRMFFQHWLPVKQEWRIFTDLFINSSLHILMVGRAGWEYDYQEDSEGVKELIKTGTRMKTEVETAFEPSLLIEMEKIKADIGKIGSGLVHRAWVIKDRSDQIQGKFFDNPGFEQFLPHINRLNIGGEHFGVDTKRDSTALFDSSNSGSNIYKRREIAMENIEQEMILRWPGSSVDMKTAKINIMEKLFGTKSWSALKDFHPDRLESALAKLKEIPVTPVIGKGELTNGKN